MTDILLNYGHITHQMKIICTFEVFTASCIRLFDRLSVIGVLWRSEICFLSRWQEGPIYSQAVFLRFYVIPYFICSEICIKISWQLLGRTWATFKMYLRVIAIVIAMIFVEIQKIFEQLFVTLAGKFKSA